MYIWRKHATSDWLRQHIDKLFARFGGAVAMIDRSGRSQTLVEVSSAIRKEAIDLQREFGGTIEKLRGDWLHQFAKQSTAKSLKIGSRLIISRTRTPKSPNSIVIPAEAAFGTGDHTTTAMCLRMLERVTRKLGDGWSMLDAGTGSGILAIAACRLGAKRIVAIDNDPLACSIAKRNARANGVRRIEFRTGDVLQQKQGGRFDIITANLFSEILIAALPLWTRQLVAEGSLILSGVLRSQEAALVAGLRRNGLAAREIRRRGKWIALLAFRTRKRS
jgi:ribosomal protein L11 methyltransferase